MTAAAMGVIAVTVLATPFISGIFGMAGGLILLGVREPGREHYVDELRRQAQRQGVADAVVMTSPRRDVRDVMAASALVLQLSPKPEAFGRTVVEALNLGVPVLGFDLAGVGEQLRQARREVAGYPPPLTGRELLQHGFHLCRDVYLQKRVAPVSTQGKQVPHEAGGVGG